MNRRARAGRGQCSEYTAFALIIAFICLLQDYKIIKEALDYLSERVRVLRRMTEEICRGKIVGFVK